MSYIRKFHGVPAEQYHDPAMPAIGNPELRRIVDFPRSPFAGQSIVLLTARRREA
jgi:hypothetical protein